MALARPRLASLPLQLRRQINATIRQLNTSTSSPASSSQTSSVSSEEVAHFSALASTWWDPHGSSRLLHLMNPLRHQFINRCEATASSLDPAISSAGAVAAATQPTTVSPSPLSSTARTRKYLDVGCGAGIFAESAARLSRTLSVTAIDPTPEVIRVAEAHKRIDPDLTGSGRLKYINTGIEDLTSHLNDSPARSPSSAARGSEQQQQQKQQTGWADVVSVFEVVEHVNKPSAFLEQCMTHVAPGGWLIGSTISRTWTSWLTTKLAAEDVLRIVPRGTHDWDKYIRPDELKVWARGQAGWGDWRVMGVMYVPGVGWREVRGGEDWGNYFFGLRRLQ